MRAKQFIEAALGTTPKRPARAGSRPDRGHTPQERYGITKDQETAFHAKLDKLVHNTFGKRDDEVEEVAVQDPGLETTKQFARSHYAGLDPKSAFQKYVIRSLQHSKEEDDAEDARLNNLERTVNTLASKVNEAGIINVPDLSKRIIEMRKAGQTDQQIRAQLIKEGIPPRYIDQAFVGVDTIQSEGKTVKKEAPKPRNFVAKNAINTGAGAHKDKKKAEKQGDTKHKKNLMDLAEMEDLLEKASRQLCKSSKPDEDLGASNLASCKSQGLRARDGEKSHLIGHGNSAVRIKVGGKRIKGKKYGGPLPDYGTRKGQ